MLAVSAITVKIKVLKKSKIAAGAKSPFAEDVNVAAKKEASKSRPFDTFDTSLSGVFLKIKKPSVLEQPKASIFDN